MNAQKKEIITKQIFKTYDKNGNPNISPCMYCPKCGAPCVSIPNIGNNRLQCSRCGFTLYKNPSPGVVVLLINDDMILLGKRDNKIFMGGKWSLPGGFIEFDEDFLSAAHREIKEETGLVIKITSIISVVSNFFSPDLHTLVIVLLAHKIHGTLQPGDDIIQLQWFPLAGPLPPMAFEADRHIINRYYNAGISGISVDPRFASF